MKTPASHHPTSAAALGQRLRVARLAAGLTQQAAAARLGWSQPNVSQLEAGQEMPSAARLARLAELYQRDPGWLLTGRDKPTPSTRATPPTAAARRTRKSCRKKSAPPN